MSEQTVYASLDVGGTKIAAALATAEGRCVAERTVPTEGYGGPEAVLERMAGVVEALAEETGRRPAALGVGLPGLLDPERGLVRFLPNLPGDWAGVPARARLEARLGVPVRLLNDARLATLGEHTYGHGRGVSTLVLFTVGTGIGGGVVIDGRLRLGPAGAAGELGSQTIVPDGPPCGCGNRGCLETLASGPAITAQGCWLLLSGRAPRLREQVGGDPGKVTPREMARAAEEGDEEVRAVLVRAAEYLGIGVGNVVTALDPDLVVIGGGVAEIGPLLFDTVRETVRRRVRLVPTGRLRIEPSRLGPRAGLLGGIALAAGAGRGL